MTKEISRLGKELRYVTQTIPTQVIQDLDRIKAADEQYTKSRKKYHKQLTASWIVFSISLVAMFFFPPLAIIFVISIFTTFYLNHHYKKYARLQIEPYRYFVVERLVDLFQRDMAEQNSLNINLDFTKSMIKPKLISEGEHPLKSGWKLKIYQDPWLNIQGEFCDRTNFDLHITEHHRNSSGWNRSRSGKRKHKSKNKFKGSEICLQLRYPAKKYGAIQVLQQDAMDAIKLPDYAEVKSFKLNSKSILLKANLPPQFDLQTSYYKSMSDGQKVNTTYETVTAMFLSLYQILNLARTLSKVSN